MKIYSKIISIMLIQIMLCVQSIYGLAFHTNISSVKLQEKFEKKVISIKEKSVNDDQDNKSMFSDSKLLKGIREILIRCYNNPCLGLFSLFFIINVISALNNNPLNSNDNGVVKLNNNNLPISHYFTDSNTCDIDGGIFFDNGVLGFNNNNDFSDSKTCCEDDICDDHLLEDEENNEEIKIKNNNKDVEDENINNVFSKKQKMLELSIEIKNIIKRKDLNFKKRSNEKMHELESYDIFYPEVFLSLSEFFKGKECFDSNFFKRKECSTIAFAYFMEALKHIVLEFENENKINEYKGNYSILFKKDIDKYSATNTLLYLETILKEYYIKTEIMLEKSEFTEDRKKEILKSIENVNANIADLVNNKPWNYREIAGNIRIMRKRQLESEELLSAA